MQEIVIKNVKSDDYKKTNLNDCFDLGGSHDRAFEFARSDVVSASESGAGKLNINFYTLQPGRSNYPYHHHYGREEVFYMISGTAILKTPKGDVQVKEGDVIFFPPGEKGSHMLTNHSSEPMTYLDIDTVSSSDVIFYPDGGNVRFMAGGMEKSFKLDSEVNYLDGE